jgi:nicotinate phosphoribosyltransferase
MTSILATDAYKFSMGEAGFPLRTETFVYSHRKGGPQVLPVDVRKFVASLIPTPAPADYAFLDQHEYEMGVGYRAAMEAKNRIVVRSLPKGSVFFPGEPVFTVTGPSALVSWLEPLVLQLYYRIQIATLALFDQHRLAAEVATVTCDAQKTLVEELLDEIEVRRPRIEAQSEVYHRQTLERVRALKATVLQPLRIFEVGLRSATCMDQHEIALEACKQAGVTRTSNAFLARKVGLTPVGTMGHEHVQRFRSDEAAFRAMSDRRPYRSSYLLDTYDTFLSGLPAAFRLMAENRDRKDSIRYDSGNKKAQYLYAVEEAKRLGVRPVHVIEDGLDLQETKAFERLRELTGVEAEEQFYGYGGGIVNPADSLLTRDRVAAVWKLSQTGPWPTMKFANDPGKESIPGRPVVFRRRSASGSGPMGIVGQQNERCPEGYSEETDSMEERPFSAFFQGVEEKVALSEETARLRRDLLEQLARMKAEGGR